MWWCVAAARAGATRARLARAVPVSRCLATSAADGCGCSDGAASAVRASMRGTVKEYRHHVVTCTGTADWGPILARESPRVAAVVDLADASSSQAGGRVKANAVYPVSGPSSVEEGDLIVFPQCKRFSGVAASSPEHVFQALANDDAVGGEPLDGLHFLVCTHGSVDTRCGTHGKKLVEMLQGELVRRGIANAHVYESSHLGGHTYAGNVIVYPSGDWYGLCNSQEDVGNVIDAAVRGSVWADLWRGRARMPEAEQRDLYATVVAMAASGHTDTEGSAVAAPSATDSFATDTGSSRSNSEVSSERAGDDNQIAVTFKLLDGTSVEVKGKLNDTLLETAHANGVMDIEGVCGGGAGCGTCHCLMSEEVFESMPAPSDEEQDMLDLLEMEGLLKDTSRLGCQVRLGRSHDGMTVSIPTQLRGFS